MKLTARRNLIDSDMIEFYSDQTLLAVIHLDALYAPEDNKINDELKKLRFQHTVSFNLTIAED